jgi:hypothetical protein
MNMSEYVLNEKMEPSCMSSSRVLLMTFRGVSESVILEHSYCKQIMVLIVGMDGSVIQKINFRPYI